MSAVCNERATCTARHCRERVKCSLLFALQPVMSRLVLLVLIFATLEVRVPPIMSNEVTRDVLIGQKISSQLIRICPLMRHLWDELTFWEEFIICILLLRTQTLWNTHDRHPVFLDIIIESSILVVSESWYFEMYNLHSIRDELIRVAKWANDAKVFALSIDLFISSHGLARR